MTEKARTDIMEIVHYFGKLPDQRLPEVMAEMKALTETDKKQLAGGIRDGSLTY